MNTAYIGFEVRRVLRSRRAVIFTLLLPVVLFEFIGPNLSKDRIGGLTGLAYYMVSMATYGIMAATFSMGGRIVAERSIGWNRQLRLTALPGWQYVVSKMIAGFSMGVPAVVLLFVLGAAHGIRMPADRWLLAGVSIVVGVLPVAVAGVWVGYLSSKIESAQQVIGLAYSVVGFLAGIWIPLEAFPHWLRDTFEVLPFAWIPRAGRAALDGGWVGWGGAAIILAWTVAFGALAARAYVRDALRV
ncbi:MAG TPA: ABC transporter permease [Mycobacteriales bacterium]